MATLGSYQVGSTLLRNSATQFRGNEFWLDKCMVTDEFENINYVKVSRRSVAIGKEFQSGKTAGI